MVNADLVNLVEDIAQVCFAINANPLDSGHDASDDSLFTGGGWIRQLSGRIDIKCMEMREKLGVDEIKKLSITLSE